MHLLVLYICLYFPCGCIDKDDIYFSGKVAQRGNRLVDACPCHFKIVMVDRVLLIHFMINGDIWTVVLSRDRSNGVRSITSQSAM